MQLENILITSWNWILLSDFASFKPTYLPEDNPADYTYFFDTSRRRTCYIAPERFVDDDIRGELPAKNEIVSLLQIRQVIFVGRNKCAEEFNR